MVIAAVSTKIHLFTTRSSDFRNLLLVILFFRVHHTFYRDFYLILYEFYVPQLVGLSKENFSFFFWPHFRLIKLFKLLLTNPWCVNLSASCFEYSRPHFKLFLYFFLPVNSMFKPELSFAKQKHLFRSCKHALWKINK